MTTEIQRENELISVKAIKWEIKMFLRNVRDSILYCLGRSRKFPTHTNKVVFVCKGNICRSAFAEYLMKAQTKGMSLSIESCGLNAGMGTPAPFEAIMTAKKFGLHMEGHLSRGWECCKLEHADLILAMEFWQYKKLGEFFPQKKRNIKLLRDFAPFPVNLLCNIYDPYGQNDRSYTKCFSLIHKSIINMRIH